MKHRHSEKGMALVITLMMLAIVTFMSVVFLSLSRRERANVKIVEEQANSRSMADVALARAQADLTGNMNNVAEAFLGAATNAPIYGAAADQQHVAIAIGAVQRALFAYDLRTSRNFFNPNGFRRTDGSKPWNVGYYDTFGNVYDNRDNRLGLSSDDYYQYIANLQYDPRPPVIVTDGKTNENRFYIDLNRNGTFDPNGVFDVTGVNNERYNATTLIAGKPPFFRAYFSGDPEWIGVLERPDLPHSETNRFIGRYAYIMMPTGKSLDINFIHNLAVFDQPTIKYDGVDHSKYRFSRNQGVGSWELNMAGFMVDLHTNVWKPLPAFYTLTTNMASGFAFRDAVGLLQFRLNSSHTNLFTPRDWFGTTNRWGVDYVDMAGDGPVVPYNLYYNSAQPNRDGISGDNDSDVRYWHGAEHMQFTSEYPDVQRYFKVNTPGASTEMFDFYKNFTNAVSSSRTNTYDRYAYYRMLGQMGADSKPALQGKIHLNFANEPGTISTNLVSWVTTNSTYANGAYPTMIVRSNTAAIVRRNDNGEEYVQRSNDLTNFFLIAAERMLRESLVTNIYLDEFAKWRTNYTIGCSYFHDPSLNAVTNRTRYIVGTPVRPDISITNIQIYHEPIALSAWRPNQLTYTNAEYTAAVHRIVQLAANIYDSMYNDPGRSQRGANDPYYPTVWRPLYNISPTNITITGWEPQANSAFAINHSANTNLFRSPSEYFTNQNVIITNISFYGQPWVVGVKKGWPNFNEFSLETHAQITRKLEVFKEPALAGKEISLTNYQQLALHTRQIYLLGLSNTVGLEAWNSYARTNDRNIRIDTRIETRVGIERVLQRDQNRVAISTRPVFASAQTFITATNNYVVSKWPGRKGNMAVKDAIPKGMPKNGESDFRIPIYTNIPVLVPDKQYSEIPGPFGTFFANPAVFQSITNTPDFVISITNRLCYLASDVDEARIIDYVTLDNIVTKVDLDEAIRSSQNYGNAVGGAGFDPASLWSTDPAVKGQNTSGVSVGVMKQLQASLDVLVLGPDLWKDYSATAKNDDQIAKFQQFMYGTNSGPMATNLVLQVPFSPSRLLYLISRYQANDPFVHYMESDLRDPKQTTRPVILKLSQTGQNDELGMRNNKRQAIRTDKLHGVEFQDPRLSESDDWQFPIAKLDDPNVATPRAYGMPGFNYRFPNIGALGQIHRGTPWQTVYLKALAAPNADPRSLSTNVAPWIYWAGSYGTHPTNDWRLVGLFTTAPSENAARGLLSVNQSGTAAWSAVLSGVPVITNSLSDDKARRGTYPPRFGIPNGPNDAVGARDLLIEPGSVQLSNIVRSINQYRAYRPMGLFSYMGEVLGSPMLSIGFSPNPNTPNFFQYSPYLRVTDAQTREGGAPTGNPDWHAFTDEALEAIPQRILSLLKDDEPRVTIYCFGQTLKPAPRSYVTSADFYNLCVNYQVTGEYVTKAVVRVEGEFKNPANPLRTVVESFEVLAPFE